VIGGWDGNERCRKTLEKMTSDHHFGCHSFAFECEPEKPKPPAQAKQQTRTHHRRVSIKDSTQQAA
jgi:hypothetical protein